MSALRGQSPSSKVVAYSGKFEGFSGSVYGPVGKHCNIWYLRPQVVRLTAHSPQSMHKLACHPSLFISHATKGSKVINVAFGNGGLDVLWYGVNNVCKTPSQSARNSGARCHRGQSWLKLFGHGAGLHVLSHNHFIFSPDDAVVGYPGQLV